MKRIALAAAAALLFAAPAQAAETITYSYDARGRLAAAARSGTVNNGVATSFAHDKADNRTAKTITGAPRSMAARGVVVVPLDGLTVIPLPSY